MDVRFHHLEALHWLWLVAALAVVVIVGHARRRRRLARLADEALLGHLAGTASGGRRIARAVLILLALVALVAALIDPRWGTRFENVQQRGIDVFIVLDVSRSMLAEDAAPNRLDRAKQYAIDLVDRLAGDRAGLVTFAGRPAVQCPLTVDYGALRLAIGEVTPESVGRGGSLLGDALRLAGESFTDDVPDHKAIVVLTDGEDHGSFPVEAAAQLHEERGVRVYTIGLGDEGEGARIPVVVNGQRTYLLHEGQEVWTKMERETLAEMAVAAGGAFVPAGTRLLDLGALYDERIGPQTKRELETARIRQREVQFQWFAGLAFVLVLIESCLGDRRATRRRATTEPAWRQAA